jgi:hypothetical protein
MRVDDLDPLQSGRPCAEDVPPALRLAVLRHEDESAEHVLAALDHHAGGVLAEGVRGVGGDWDDPPAPRLRRADLATAVKLAGDLDRSPFKSSPANADPSLRRA